MCSDTHPWSCNGSTGSNVTVPAVSGRRPDRSERQRRRSQAGHEETSIRFVDRTLRRLLHSTSGHLIARSVWATPSSVAACGRLLTAATLCSRGQISVFVSSHYRFDGAAQIARRRSFMPLLPFMIVDFRQYGVPVVDSVCSSQLKWTGLLKVRATGDSRAQTPRSTVTSNMTRGRWVPALRTSYRASANLWPRRTKRTDRLTAPVLASTKADVHDEPICPRRPSPVRSSLDAQYPNSRPAIGRHIARTPAQSDLS